MDWIRVYAWQPLPPVPEDQRRLGTPRLSHA